jgi:membrane fusion protein (multidrug efflux system)
MKTVADAVRVALPVLAAAALLTACGGKDKETGEKEELKAVPVAVEEVGPGRVEDWLELPGKIDPFRQVTVSAEVGGLLERQGVDEGDAVTKGQELAVIDRENLELQVRQAELALDQARLAVQGAEVAGESAAAAARQAEAMLAQAVEMERKARAMRDENERDLERGRALFAEKLTPKSQVEELEMGLESASADLASAGEGVKAATAAREVAEAGGRSADTSLGAALSMVKTAEANLEQARLFLRRSIISSPLDGRVDHTYFEAGELVKAQDPLMRIVQVRPVKAVFHLAEKDVSFLRTGMEAAVTVSAVSSGSLKGTVSLIGVTTDPSTSTYRLEVDLPNGESALRPGMLAELRLLRQGIDDALMVPAFAVMSGATESFLFVYDDGVARRRAVKTGIVEGDMVQVVSGVAAGDRVIVKGQRDLEDAQKVSLP